MRKIGRTVQLMTGIWLTAVLLCTTCLSAFAADTTDLDFGQKGSISLTLYSDEAKSAVKDGALTLYEVADLVFDDGNMAYDKTAAFAGFDGELNVEDTSLASALSNYVSENGVTGITTTIASDGSVYFSNLTLGLYLIVQTTQSTGYYIIDPFLVTVPLAQDDIWNYSVEASPKVEVYAEPEPTPEPTPKPEPTPTPTPDKTLPQTGQLFWPIPVLTGLGVLLIVVGTVMRRRRRAA